MTVRQWIYTPMTREVAVCTYLILLETMVTTREQFFGTVRTLFHFFIRRGDGIFRKSLGRHGTVLNVAGLGVFDRKCRVGKKSGGGTRRLFESSERSRRTSPRFFQRSESNALYLQPVTTMTVSKTRADTATKPSSVQLVLFFFVFANAQNRTDIYVLVRVVVGAFSRADERHPLWSFERSSSRVEAGLVPCD